MSRNQRFLCRDAIAIALCAMAIGVVYEAKGQGNSTKPKGDPMLAMFRQARADADARFQKGYSSLQPSLSYAPLANKTANGSVWVDLAWEELLNRHNVYVGHFKGLLTPRVSQKSQRAVRQVKHRQWTRRFLRSELLPPKNDWPTQFYLAPNGDEVAVTSWRSNGFSIRVCDGKSLCVVVRPDDTRDVFGHTLAQLLAARKSGQTSRSWYDYLPPAYDLSIYAQELYALTTPVVAKVGSLVGITVQADGKFLNRINAGHLSLYQGDPVSGIPALPRAFAQDVRYWTDGTSVVFAVDKLLAPSTPIKSR